MNLTEIALLKLHLQFQYFLIC